MKKAIRAQLDRSFTAATEERIDKWRGNALEASCILDIPYWDLRSRTVKLKLLGRTSKHRRYGLRELFKFKLAFLLVARNFSIKNIRAFFEDREGGLNWILGKLKARPDAKLLFFIYPIENDEVKVVEIDEDKHPEAWEVMARIEPDRAAVLLDIDGIYQEVRRRLECHLDKTPYLKHAPDLGKSLAQVRKERAAEMRA